MSAEALRRAATKMRDDESSCFRGDAFLLAVADLLEAEADAGEIDGLWQSALAVARAYLGESQTSRPIFSSTWVNLGKLDAKQDETLAYKSDGLETWVVGEDA